MRISPEERVAIKIHAQDMAATMNYTAAALALAAAGTFIAPPVAAALAGSSAIAWLAAQAWQDMANDPPRADFQMIELAKVRPHADLHAASGVWLQWAQAQLESTLAVRKLLASIERYDGAAGNIDAAEPCVAVRRAELAEMQLIAIEHNAHTVADHQERLLSLSRVCNIGWYSENSMTVRSSSVLDVQGVRDTFSRYGEVALLVLQTSLGWTNDEIVEATPRISHPIFADDYRIEPSQFLIKIPSQSGTPAVSSALRNLIVQDGV